MSTAKLIHLKATLSLTMHATVQAGSPPPCTLQTVYCTGSDGPFGKPYRAYNTYLNAVCLSEQAGHLLRSPARQ